MSDREGYLKRRDTLLMQDEEIAELKAEIEKLEGEVAELKALVSEALSNMEYYPASLGEMWLVQDSDITAMQAATLEEGAS